MALGKRLIIEGSDINDNNLTVNVWLEGYAGAAVTRISAGDIATFKSGAQEGNELPLIYGTEATFRLLAENDFEFKDLFAANAKDIFVEAILNDTDPVFYGFAEAEKYTEPLIAPRFQVSITAFDGLGLLKDEDFKDENKNPYTGQLTPLEILQLILNKTGLSLPLNAKVNIHPDGLSVYDNALTQVKKDLATYIGLSCYEVLEKLFIDCRITQREGEWWITSNDEFKKNSTITYYHYDAAGNYTGTKQATTAVNGWYIQDIGKMEMIPPLKQLTVIQDYGYKPNLITNGGFTGLNGSNFDGWTAVNCSPEQRVYDTDGNRFVYIPGIERLDPWDTADRTKYMISDAINVKQSAANMTIGLGYALMGPSGNSGYVFFGAFIEGDGGIDYALEAYLYEGSEGREVRYQWIAAVHKYAVPVAAHVKKDENWPFADTYSVEPDRIDAYPWNEIASNFRTAEINIEGGIPAAGTLKIYLFEAHTGGIVAGNCFRDVKVSLTDENNDQFPTTRELIIINSLKNNYVPDDLELPNGDLPDLPNNLTIYNGGFILNSGLNAGDPTSTWILDGNATPYTWAELMARMFAAQMKAARDVYDIILGNTMPNTAIIITDADNNNKKFIEAGITYNFRMATTEGRFIELVDLNIDDFTTAEKINYDTPTKTTTASTAPTVVNTDEKVKLIDPTTYELTGQPGYLSNADFTQTIDEATGRAKIEIAKITNRYAKELSEGETLVDTGLELHSLSMVFLNGKLTVYSEDWEIVDTTKVNFLIDILEYDKFFVLK